MSNFHFLKQEAQFSGFADVDIAAEKIIHIDAEASVLNRRRVMEFAAKRMYSVDDSLVGKNTPAPAATWLSGSAVSRVWQTFRRLVNKILQTDYLTMPEQMILINVN